MNFSILQPTSLFQGNGAKTLLNPARLSHHMNAWNIFFFGRWKGWFGGGDVPCLVCFVFVFLFFLGGGGGGQGPNILPQ